MSFRFDPPWSVEKMSIEEFLIGMSTLGTPQEIQMVGSFGQADDTAVRTAHRDTVLPFHRDGIYTKSIADMQNGAYVEKPNVDIVGLYCVRDTEEPCYTTISEDGEHEIAAVNLRAGDALVMDNRLWHGRRGQVGKRLLIRFWVTKRDCGGSEMAGERKGTELAPLGSPAEPHESPSVVHQPSDRSASR